MAYPYDERLRGYREEVDFALEQGEGPTLRWARERLSTLELTADEHAELAEIDAGAVEFIVELDEIAPYLLEDDPAQPLEKWWWHLRAIRNRAYPLELLPEHLREWAS